MDAHKPTYLTFKNIESEFPVKAATLKCWKATGKYDFHKIVLKLGRTCLVKRSDWIRFLETRTGIGDGQ